MNVIGVILMVVIGFCCFELGQLIRGIKILTFLQKEISVAGFKPGWDFINKLIDHL